MEPATARIRKQELPPHPITAEVKKYLGTMTAEQLELHAMATTLLGSSYFVERTRGFRAWKDATKAK
jgi:hypothetical protein